jgi:hypothetical protein
VSKLHPFVEVSCIDGIFHVCTVYISPVWWLIRCFYQSSSIPALLDFYITASYFLCAPVYLTIHLSSLSLLPVYSSDSQQSVSQQSVSQQSVSQQSVSQQSVSQQSVSQQSGSQQSGSQQSGSQQSDSQQSDSQQSGSQQSGSQQSNSQVNSLSVCLSIYIPSCLCLTPYPGGSLPCSRRDRASRSWSSHLKIKGSSVNHKTLGANKI